VVSRGRPKGSKGHKWNFHMPIQSLWMYQGCILDQGWYQPAWGNRLWHQTQSWGRRSRSAGLSLAV